MKGYNHFMPLFRFSDRALPRWPVTNHSLVNVCLWGLCPVWLCWNKQQLRRLRPRHRGNHLKSFFSFFCFCFCSSKRLKLPSELERRRGDICSHLRVKPIQPFSSSASSPNMTAEEEKCVCRCICSACLCVRVCVPLCRCFSLSKMIWRLTLQALWSKLTPTVYKHVIVRWQGSRFGHDDFGEAEKRF